MEKESRRARKYRPIEERVRAKSFWDKLEKGVKPPEMIQIGKHEMYEKEEKLKPIVERRFPGWQEEFEKKVYYGTQQISAEPTREQIESFREQKRALETVLERRRAMEKAGKSEGKPAKVLSPSERLIRAHRAEMLQKGESSELEKLQEGIKRREAEEAEAFKQLKEREAEEIRIRRMPIEERIKYLKSK